MRVRVVFYPTMIQDLPARDLSELTKNLESGGERKFVLLRGSDEWLVAIGPAWTVEDRYQHERLLAKVVSPHFETAGGGWVKFFRSKGNWTAVFYGSSQGLGEFDHKIEEAADQLGISLGMPVVIY